ncbi:MAG: hypothetical protein IPO27_05000 [Bacteroidetes bacterium]|nr:hypothetical protein [Bacteroidota bacterium]
MTMISHLTKMAHYNCWANEKVATWLVEAGDEVCNAAMISSFNNIRLTAQHIYDAETVWIMRLTGLQLKSWPPSADFNFGIEVFKNIWISNSNELLQMVLSFSESDLSSLRQYPTIKNDGTYSSLVADMLMHCFNHSTYHRGQIVAMLRQQGFDKVESTDFITFTRL